MLFQYVDKLAFCLGLEHYQHYHEACQCTKALHDAQMHFHDRIAQLVYTFPEDAPTSTGALFWSAPKRFPRALEWSAADPSHVAFVQAAALLRAEVFGITPPAWAQDPAKVIPPMAAAAAVLWREWVSSVPVALSCGVLKCECDLPDSADILNGLQRVYVQVARERLKRYGF